MLAERFSVLIAGQQVSSDFPGPLSVEQPAVKVVFYIADD